MHYPIQNLEVYSANPLLLNPTHYVGDAGWYSDTGQSHTILLFGGAVISCVLRSLLIEPPPEVLAKIRERKRQEEKEYEEKVMLANLLTLRMRREWIQTLEISWAALGRIQTHNTGVDICSAI